MVQNNGRAVAPAPFQPPKDASLFWTALMEDTLLPAMVLSLAGVIEFANAEAARLMGVEPGAAIGRQLNEFYSEEMVAERMALVADAVKAGRSIAVVGMCRGRMMHSVCRPIVSDGQPTKVLMVCRLAGGGEPVTVEGGDLVRARVDDPGALGTLTAREFEILKFIGVGLSTAEIAQRLGRSVKTVEWHRVSLGNKLGVTNRVELARIAIAAGIVGLDHPLMAARPAGPLAAQN